MARGAIRTPPPEHRLTARFVEQLGGLARIGTEAHQVLVRKLFTLADRFAELAREKRIGGEQRAHGQGAARQDSRTGFFCHVSPFGDAEREMTVGRRFILWRSHATAMDPLGRYRTRRLARGRRFDGHRIAHRGCPFTLDDPHWVFAGSEQVHVSNLDAGTEIRGGLRRGWARCGQGAAARTTS